MTYGLDHERQPELQQKQIYLTQHIAPILSICVLALQWPLEPDRDKKLRMPRELNDHGLRQRLRNPTATGERDATKTKLLPVLFFQINNPTVSDKSAESSECHDSFIATSCDESDENAVDMYHSAVHCMRNAQAARQQLRASSTSCPVCAKFAAYLQHFI